MFLFSVITYYKIYHIDTEPIVVLLVWGPKLDLFSARDLELPNSEVIRVRSAIVTGCEFSES